MDFFDTKLSEIDGESYLAHHGILGQKWGVRRYQNSDGTLTELGKKRYGKELQKKVNAKDRNMYKEAHVVGLSAAIKANNRNAAETREKIVNDPKYGKAYDEYTKALNDAIKLGNDLQKKYESNGASDISDKDQKKMQVTEQKIRDRQTAMGEAWINAVNKHEPELLSAKLADIGDRQTAMGEAWINAVNKHEPELLSAKLADIGEPNTEVGRELIKEVYKNKRKNSSDPYSWIYD